MKSLYLLTLIIFTGFHSNAQELISSNTVPVGLEYNILFNADKIYTVAITGPNVSSSDLFDGVLKPTYTSSAPTKANPLVITIENLPKKHIQNGAWVGWTTRYWEAKNFKIEGFDEYYGRGWTLLSDYSTRDYKKAKRSYFVKIPKPGAYTKLRFTFYSGRGVNGRIGLSELVFIHPEATSPYKNLISYTNKKSTDAIVIKGRNPISSVNNFTNKIELHGTSAAIVYAPGTKKELMFGFHRNGNFYWGTGNSTAKTPNYYSMYLQGSTGHLGIKGRLTASEVKVTVKGWSDYVFQKYYTGTSKLKADYTMPTLEEVEAFTKANHHLPNMPSAAEIKANGLLLGEMNNLLLQKIEELTLYSIEQEKRLQALEAK